MHKEQHEEIGPNTSLLAKELREQWHVQRNMHHGNINIKPYSHRKVWWSCDQCPEGLPHVWETSVNNRTHGAGCPFCTGQGVCQHNTLAQKAPEVALFWDAMKNYPLTPDQVTVSSHMRAHWKCSACLHEWQTSVTVKARDNSGCPMCAKSNGGGKAGGTRQKHPTFAAADHDLLEQWDHDRNSADGNFPDNTSLQSNKLIWWHCQECPKEAGRLPQIIELARGQEDALAVWENSCVNATLWKRSVLMLLLILTSPRMVSVPLK